MQIEGVNNQQQSERIFNDFLARQNVADHKDFTLDIDSYRSVSLKGAQQIIKDPSKYYVLIKKYLETLSNQSHQIKKKSDSKVDHYNIKIQGNLGANFVTPRGLNSRMANQLVGLQGIITKMDISKAYLEKSIHWCQKTKSYETRSYPDSFNPQKDNQLNRPRTIKTVDDKDNPLQFEYGLSSFKDTQLVVIQQLPQMAPPGLLPMSVQVVLQNSLVGSVKPGDRVQMIGIYKLIAGQNSKQKGIFRPFFICLSIRPLQQLASSMSKPIKSDMFKRQQIFDLFSRSIAPSVWGHQNLKKAVLLMLVGGVQKNLETGTHLRGDINLLVIGDPGTAKSQMLRWVLSTVDISVGTTGSGASGVGLTAAIVADKQTGQRTLEAGAMVLADRGVVCIDQFDKMNETDRVAVHEVMEQQTVTISKAGMHCSLNARCAVIAAANPIYGQYQKNMPPTKNIGMPDSLLSRFDLIFVVLDDKDNQRDKQIADKVCRNHRLAPQSNDFLNQYMNPQDYVVNPVQQKKNDENIIYQKNNVYKGEGSIQLIDQRYLKRYINYVKPREPMLTDQSVKFMAELWRTLREKDFQQKQSTFTKVLPVTIRTHQSLIRLSTAHAKLLQSDTVEIENVYQAFKLMVFCYYADQNALDQEVESILKQLKLDFIIKPKKSKYNNKIYEPDKKEQNYQQKRKMEPQQEVNRRMQKLNIRAGQKELNQVLDKQTFNQEDLKFTSQQRAAVYKKCSDIQRKKKSSQKMVKFDQLWNQVQSVIQSKKKLDAILKDLEQEGKIMVQDGLIYIT